MVKDVRVAAIGMRIKDVQQLLGINRAQMRAVLGMTPDTYDAVTEGRSEVAVRHLLNLKDAAPQLSWQWLLSGTGRMSSGLKNKIW